MKIKKFCLLGVVSLIEIILLFLLLENLVLKDLIVICLVIFLSKFLFLKFYDIAQNKSISFQEDIGRTLEIAHEALPYLRHGLDENTAGTIATIIKKIGDVHAVAITDTQKVLSFIGVGCENHQPGDPIKTEATREVIKTGKHKIIKSSKEFNCRVTDCKCPLGSAVIVPIVCQEKVIGALKLYSTQSGKLPEYSIRLAKGLGQLLSMQAQLAELERQTGLITQARLEALHAQINPHFFFNIINTIVMYSRTNPEKTRDLLITLAEFFRQTLNRKGHFITLEEELQFVDTYLILEKARFGDKINIVKNINENLLKCQIPVFAIQPLVENAIKHGLTPKIGKGTLEISADLLNENIILISVADDGVGIPEDKIEKVIEPGYGSGNGVGLSNVNERLISLYGPEYGINISSRPGEGTCIYLLIPTDVSVHCGK